MRILSPVQTSSYLILEDKEQKRLVVTSKKQILKPFLKVQIVFLVYNEPSVQSTDETCQTLFLEVRGSNFDSCFLRIYRHTHDSTLKYATIASNLSFTTVLSYHIVSSVDTALYPM